MSAHAHHAFNFWDWLAGGGIVWVLILYWWFGDTVREILSWPFHAISNAADARRKHELKLEKIRLEQARLLAKPMPKRHLVAGPCAHTSIAPVMTRDELEPELVAWVCRNPNCQMRLPADWAVREEDPG